MTHLFSDNTPPAGKNDASDESLESLRERLRHYDRLYREGQPKISDREYDLLLQTLREREREEHVLGDDRASGFTSVEHLAPMLSIDNTYNIDELKQFGQRVTRVLGDGNAAWIVELKIDGVAVSLLYEDGVLVHAASRGNGKVGDNITHNIAAIDDIPHKLVGEKIPECIEIRGEIYMEQSELARLNAAQIARGESPFKNPRNCVAGSLRQLDSAVCRERRLRFFAHGIGGGGGEGIDFTSHRDFLHRLAAWHIPTTPHWLWFASFAAAVQYCEEHNLADSIDFEIDGLVLKVDSFDLRERLGATDKVPRWGIAYKVERYEATTRIENITVQVGKFGTLTPVAELAPVEIAGTTVSRASLHNAEQIVRLDVRVGDTVVVAKAGKIIPQVVRVEPCDTTSRTKPFIFPESCPVCETPIQRDDDDNAGVAVRCPNRDCSAQRKERLRFFASRAGMEIDGLGESLIKKLVDERLVRSFGDLYRLTAEQLATPEQQKSKQESKSAQKLVAAIAASKKRPLSRLLAALSIRHVGGRTAESLAAHFGSLEAIRSATTDDFRQVADVGDVVAESLAEFFADAENTAMLSDLKSLELAATTENIAPTKTQSDVAGIFAGKTFVVTGTLERMTRSEAESLIREHGGRIASSVSAKTSFVVVGESPGSKLDKATQLGIRVLSEEEFLKSLS